jgi:[protein-PII] uridylyltransferase
MQFDVAAARIYTTRHGFALDSFQVLPKTKGGEHYRELIQKLEAKLAEKIATAGPIDVTPPGRISRWVKHFPIEPRIAITPDRRSGHWLVTVSCADRPGLLSTMARIFYSHGLNLIDARVTTLGARAEDAFVLHGVNLESPNGREAIASDLHNALAA